MIDQILVAKAMDGDVNAQIKVGDCYSSPFIEEYEIATAYEWYKKAAISDNDEGKYKAAVLEQGIIHYAEYDIMPHSKENFADTMHSLAKKNYALAKFSVGVQLINGYEIDYGVEEPQMDFIQDIGEGFEWLQRAIGDGVEEAKSFLGNLIVHTYLDEITGFADDMDPFGIKSHIKTHFVIDDGIKLLQEVSSLGKWIETGLLAECYHFGCGVEKSLEVFKELKIQQTKECICSAQNGDIRAFENLFIFGDKEEEYQGLQRIGKLGEILVNSTPGMDLFAYYEIGDENSIISIIDIIPKEIIETAIATRNQITDKLLSIHADRKYKSAMNGDRDARLKLAQVYIEGNDRTPKNLEKATDLLNSLSLTMSENRKIANMYYKEKEYAYEMQYRVASQLGSKNPADYEAKLLLNVISRCDIERLNLPIDSMCTNTTESVKMDPHDSIRLSAVRKSFEDTRDRYNSLIEVISRGDINEYLESANSGNLFFQIICGDCYKDGRLVDKNFDEAFRWYKKASDNAYKAKVTSFHLCCNLSDCYKYGIGVQQDQEQSIQWRIKANRCKTSYANDLFYEATEIINNNKKSAISDKTKAQLMLNKAALLGCPDAIVEYIDQRNMESLYAEDGLFDGLDLYNSYMDKVSNAKMTIESSVAFARKNDASAMRCIVEQLPLPEEASIEYILNDCRVSSLEFLQWLDVVSKQADAQLLFKIGKIYEHGVNGYVAKNLSQALLMYEESADMEYYDAQKCLIEHYEDGIGCEIDIEKVIRYKNIYFCEKLEELTERAQADDYESQYKLAECYQYGKYTDVNYESAIYWYNVAAKNGNKDAQSKLITIYKEGDMVPSDIERSLYWSRIYNQSAIDNPFECLSHNQAALYGSVNGITEVASSYLNKDNNSSEDITKGMQWLKLAAQSLSPRAIVLLAIEYFKGTKTTQDYKKCVAWLRFYENLANKYEKLNTYRITIRAYFYLAFCYSKGLGVDIDGEKSNELLEKALAICEKKYPGELKSPEFNEYKLLEDDYQIEHNKVDSQTYIEQKAFIETELKRCEIQIKEKDEQLREKDEQLKVKEEELTEKEKELRQMTGERDAYKDIATGKINEVSDKVDEMHKGIIEINETQKRWENMITSVFNDTSEAKNKLEQILSTVENIDIKECEITKFINERTTSIINDTTVNSDACHQAELELRGIFGDKWQRLDAYSQKALVSAKTLLGLTSNLNIPDYSGICICATSALELELRKIFFDGYKEYVDNGHSVATALDDRDYFYIGSLPYLFGIRRRKEQYGQASEEDRKANKKLMLGYCSKISKSANSFVCAACPTFTSCPERNDTFCALESDVKGGNKKECRYSNKCFIGRCEKIRINYRNVSAHAGEIIELEAAKECCNIIIGKEEAMEHVGQIQGLLYELL